jgi:cytosine/adenosine deaminase-related metal-dependent hydrolase
MEQLEEVGMYMRVCFVCDDLAASSQYPQATPELHQAYAFVKNLQVEALIKDLQAM